MILAHAANYWRTQGTFSSDDSDGASIAHAEFLRAALQYSLVDEIHIYRDMMSSDIDSPGRLEPWNELRQQFPNRNLRRVKTAELASLAAPQPYVLYGSGVALTPFAQIRSAYGCRFPICNLTHSVDVPMAMLFVPGALLASEPYDVLVASSKAGTKALQALLEASVTLLQSKCEGSRRISQPQIVHIPFGVDAKYLVPQDQQYSRSILGLPVSALILLYTGRFSDVTKADLEPLMVIFRKLAEDFPDAHLVLAGQDTNGAYSRSLISLAAELGIQHKVTFIRNFPHFAKQLIYAAADIFVSPVDNIQETFGLAVAEASASGLPVVASDWSGYREIVLHGRTGFLVHTQWDSEGIGEICRSVNALQTNHRRHLIASRTTIDLDSMLGYLRLLAQNQILRRSMGDEARQRMRSLFSWSSIIRQHELLWSDLWKLSAVASPPKQIVEDYSVWFAHFVTESIGAQLMNLQISLGIRGDEFTVERLREKGVILSTEFIDSIRNDGAASPAFADVMHSLDLEGRSQIWWLLKKGFLKLSSHSEQNDAKHINGSH